MDLFSEAGRAALSMSLDELVARTDGDLAQRDLFRQAARSALYASRWKAAGVRPDGLRGRAGLRGLPFIDGRDLIAMTETAAGLRKALLTRPRVWVTSRGTASGGVASATVASGGKKWLPLTLKDTAHWFSRAQRVLELLPGYDDGATATALMMNEPMPSVSNALPYLWERADYLSGRRRFEFVIAATSMLWRNHWDRFALKKQPEWLAGSAADARCLAQEMGANVSHLMKAPSRGLFWGEPLDGAGGSDTRQELHRLYGLSESFAIYLSAECRELYAECPAHDGLHLWMDGVVHEILPDGTGQGALFIDQAPAGTEGEYVVTTLDEALPLVRYRTGDRIRVAGTGPCACGITHPRVHFVGRVETR